jgi:hypothetical protein
MNNKKLDFGKTLESIFDVFKKTYLVAGFAFLVLTVILLVMAFIGLNHFVGFENLEEQLKTFDPAKLSMQGTIIYIICMLIFAILLSPFNAGLLKIMKDADENQEISFTTLFHYVNSQYYFRIIGLAIILGLVNAFLSVGLKKLIPFDASWVGLLSTSLSVIFSIITLLTLPNIVFRDLSIISSIKESISFCSTNFFQILLLLIIALAIGYAGILLFCIGMFFTFPIYYATQYCIYKSTL